MEVQTKLFEEGTLKCDCPQPCQEKAYLKSMSFSKWPAANYQSKLTSKLSNLQISLLENTGDAMKWIGDNLARVQIYFEELNYQSIKETPSYTEFDLCSDIGGQLGLWIGVSVITLCEMFEFFASISRLFYRRLSVSVAMPSRSVTPVQEITLESLY
ncbi:degenerin unc-8-like [Ptychodera flava]|uniref:degenerin unc-8-like n=1 Tax=Ptychodera flava TaxID=63121 RepID=UPI00396A64A0